jgi:ubiquinone/menaquinone biosynthesis C-methylase UbiE
MRRSRFVPALGFGFLTRWYDPVLSAFLPEAKVRRHLVERLGLEPGQRVLDLGCGTGTLLVAMHAACPGAEYTGLDIDPRILELASRKLKGAGVPIFIVQTDAAHPPFSAGSFERVVSSLVLHHLPANDHVPVLARARELLAPGGELHLIDWGPSRGVLPRIAAVIERLADGWKRTADSFEGRLPELLRSAGFGTVEGVQRIETRIGALDHYRATQ